MLSETRLGEGKGAAENGDLPLRRAPLKSLKGSQCSKRSWRSGAYLALVLIPLAGGVPPEAQAQSFDCRKAETDTEWAICNTPELGKLDSEAAKTYSRLLDSGKNAPDFRKRVEEMQVSWIHGNRDLCGGDVACLKNAYNSILTALNALPPADTASGSAGDSASNNRSIVPACSTIDHEQSLDNDIDFDRVVCGKGDLLRKMRQIEEMGNDLLPRLPAAWKPAFAAQQSGFPGMGSGCMAGQIEECVSQAIDQRIQDLKDFASYLGKSLPTCQPEDVAIKDSGYGDAGMSQNLTAYLIEYSGTNPCRLHGYPAVVVRDGKGKPQWTAVEYSGSTYFSQIVGPPLPVTLSKDNSTVWFGLHTANACDPLPDGEHLTVDVALPLSRIRIHTITLDYANCLPITVTPIAMISTVRSLIQ